MEEKDFKSLVIEKAREIFIKYGYKKTSMEDIAKACNKSKGLIYHHYKSKEEIFKLIATNEVNQILIDIIKKINSIKDVKEKIKIFTLTWYSFLNDNANLYHKIIIDIIEYIYIIKEMIEDLHMNIFNLIKDILKEGQDKQIFFIEDIEKTTKSVFHMIMGFNYSSIMYIFNFDTNKFNDHNDIDNYMNLIFSGLEKR